MWGCGLKPEVTAKDEAWRSGFGRRCGARMGLGGVDLIGSLGARMRVWGCGLKQGGAAKDEAWKSGFGRRGEARMGVWGCGSGLC